MYYLNSQKTNYSIDVNTKKLGHIGESVAQAYLLRHGYTVLDRNWTCRWGELDIVALKGNRIAFFEVKTRSNTNYGSPFEAISFYKRRALLRSIHNYLAFNGMRGKVWSLDLLGIEVKNSQYKLYHWEDMLS